MVGVEMVNTNNTSMVKLGVSDNFPVGMRILAVDDDPVCLSVLTQMLRQCSYEVTFCTRAREALALLREKKDGFDLVISDVVMPDMDGFKLLELIGLEMDLPVIMTSSHGETSTVMKGVTHGACDYLLKPVRIEELRNIWQHVVRRRKHNETKDVEASYGSMDESERQHRRNRSDDGADYTSSANDGANDSTWKHQKRRKDEDDNEQEEDPSTLKKPRVVWSVELHQQFVNAVNTLGIDKAVPKKILEHMNVQGLTRENVASHLQKYRLYLRRLSGAQQSPGAAASFCSPSADPTFGFAPLSNTVHFPPVQAGIMRPHTNMDPSMLVQPQVGYLRPQAHLNMHNQVNINQMNIPHSRINLPNPSSLEVNRGGLAVSIPNRGGLEVNLPDQISPVENVYGQYRHNGYRPMGYPLHIPYSTQGVVSSNTPYTDDSGIIVTSPGIRTKMSNLTIQNNGNANGNHGEGIGVTVSHHPSIPARFAVDDNEQMGTSGELDTGNDIASIYFEERFMSNDYRL